MEKEFDKVMISVLETYEKNSSLSIDEILDLVCKQHGLSEEDKKLLADTFAYLDAFTDKTASLAQAKAAGKSRQGWVLSQMDEILEGRTEEEKAQIVSAISEANEHAIDSLTENEWESYEIHRI